MYLITPSDLRDEPDDAADMDTGNQTDEKDSKVTDKASKEKQSNMDIENKDNDALNTSKQMDNIDVMDVETNPFLRSITRNLKKEENITNKLEDCTLEDESDVYKRIVEYFLEFVDQEEYTVLRFLGAFNEDEVKDINKFLDDAKKCVSGDFDNVTKEVVNAIKERSFDVHEDVNGFTM